MSEESLIALLQDYLRENNGGHAVANTKGEHLWSVCERIVNISKISDILNASSEHAQDLNTSRTLIGCPHCEKSMCDAVENDYGRWQIFCGACGSSSGTYKTREEAVAGWNRRAPVTQGEISVVEDKNV